MTKKKSKAQKKREALGRISEIGFAAIAAEEYRITLILDGLVERIGQLPGKRNEDCALHRVRGLCYRMWTGINKEAHDYARGNLKKCQASD